MKTVYRQDGSAVDLTDDDADKWIALGLATPSPAVPAKQATPPKNGTTTDEGVSA